MTWFEFERSLSEAERQNIAKSTKKVNPNFCQLSSHWPHSERWAGVILNFLPIKFHVTIQLVKGPSCHTFAKIEIQRLDSCNHISCNYTSCNYNLIISSSNNSIKCNNHHVFFSNNSSNKFRSNDTLLKI
ncbi:hypothetical protein HELRODRAFT_181449 [Helobdella robusta]|uniref:Uncharacterized protein n=1 Tax=Helobdella robusta TaxID=6412 RepID=T1FH07_HELRO|nr:hypothetical protein HELRODRAFT_181449 [Helobdella robusta]ESN92401.1 hypothetical protein HELRODRAFT_181449 [Helobdella robusta]